MHWSEAATRTRETVWLMPTSETRTANERTSATILPHCAAPFSLSSPSSAALACSRSLTVPQSETSVLSAHLIPHAQRRAVEEVLQRCPTERTECPCTRSFLCR